MNHIVFISYAKEDKEIAYSICNALESEGIKCWIAPRNILPGVQYPDAIISALKTTQKVVVVLTHHSNTSHFVMKELERAVSRKIPIIPFRTEDIELSDAMELFLSSTQWLDASSFPIESHIPKLIESIDPSRELTKPLSKEPIQTKLEEPHKGNHVFISHSNIDKEIAITTCDFLEQQGIKCWIAPRDLPSTGSFARIIVEAIEKAKVFLLILTKRINSSKEVEQEVELAAKNNIPIQPFRTENVEPSPNLQYFIGAIHYLDAFTPPLEQHLSKLANLILRYYY